MANYKNKYKSKKKSRGYTSQKKKLDSRIGRYKPYKRGQNMTKNAYWFKSCGDIQSYGATPPAGNANIFLRTTPNDIFPIPSFINECRNWSAYKIVKVICKYIPAYVGSETTQLQAGQQNRFQRGNCVTYIVQGAQVVNVPSQPVQGYLSQLMGYPSAKLHQPRATIKRWMNRPSGGRYFDWTFINHPQPTAGVPSPTPNIANDAWDSEIRIFGDGYGLGSGPLGQNKPYYFVEKYFKVVFRSRWRGGTIQPLSIPQPLPVVTDPPQEDQSDDNKSAVPP